MGNRLFILYRSMVRTVTSFVKSQSSRAAAKGDDPRARAVGFLMALYQRRLASSADALRHSLENRARRLAEGLKRAQDIALTASDLPEAEDMDEMEEAERDRIERVLEAFTLAQNPTLVREEIAELEELAKRAGGSRG